MKSQLLSLLNPCRILSVEDAMNICILLYPKGERDYKTLELLQSYESLLKERLTKEMFVCEVEKPEGEPWEVYSAHYNNDMKKYKRREGYKEYESAQGKVLFEGFDSVESSRIFMRTGELVMSIDFEVNKITINHSDKVLLRVYLIAYVKGLLYHIEKYNETATSKIELTWTEAIFKELNLKG